MSCDSGIGMSPESDSQSRSAKEPADAPTIAQISSPKENADAIKSSESEGVQDERDAPVVRKRGISPEHAEAQSENAEESEKIEEPRRSRGRPKGAKNKNPKPKPPPKPKRPKGRPRKNSQFISARVTRQSFARIEPVSEKPPDNIFEDSS